MERVRRVVVVGIKGRGDVPVGYHKASCRGCFGKLWVKTRKGSWTVLIPICEECFRLPMAVPGSMLARKFAELADGGTLIWEETPVSPPR